MHLSHVVPDGVLLVASAVYMAGEDYPTVELALYRSDFDPGKSDARQTGEMEFGPQTVRLFFPSSGCGIVIDDKGIVLKAEPGLQGIMGRRASIFQFGRSENILVVWTSEEIYRDQLDDVIRVTRGLSMALT